MKKAYVLIRRSEHLAAALLLLAATLVSLIPARKAEAAQMTARSVTLSSSANGNINVGTAGTGGNGARAKHTAGFTPATTATTVGSIILMYCDSPVHGSTCNTPTGLSVQNVTAITETMPGTAWILDTTTNNTAVTGCNGGASTTRANCLFIKESANQTFAASAYTIAYGGGASDYVINPTTDNYTFYLRMYTFNGTTFGGGSPTNPVTANVDYGAMAASTADQIDITAIVKETLTFSVGATYVAPSTTCAALTNAGIALGDSDGVLSTGQAYDKHSWFRVHTNGLNGTVVQYSGPTLTSGSNTITAPSTETASTVGTEQFGLAYNNAESNLVTEGLPGDLVANANYNEGNGTITNGGTARFNFSTGSVTTPVEIASTGGLGTGTVDCDTMAIRYIGNISTATEAGVYTSTITYIATPTF